MSGRNSGRTVCQIDAGRNFGLVARDGKVNTVALVRRLLNAKRLVAACKVGVGGLCVVRNAIRTIRRLEGGDLSRLENIAVVVEYIAGAGMDIDFTPSLRNTWRFSAGVGCGTGANSIIFDGSGSSNAPTVASSGATVFGIGGEPGYAANSMTIGNASQFKTNAESTTTIGHRNGAANPQSIAIGNDQTNQNGGTMITIGNRISVSGELGQESIIIGHDANVVSGDYDRGGVVGNDTNSASPGGVQLGNNQSARARFDCMIGYNLRSTTNNSEIMIGNSFGIFESQAATGRVYFGAVEPVGSAGTISGTTPDAYIPIQWNNTLVYLPGYLVKPPL